jgi:hypothetical protein
VQSLAVLLPQSRGIYMHNIMADYDKFRNHMEEPEISGALSGLTEDDKQLIANAATLGIMGVGTVIAGPAVAVLGGCLWAIDRARRNP